MKTKESREGYEIEADVVDEMYNGKSYRRQFPMKVNSLDPKNIQTVIDYWRDHLKRDGRNSKLVVKEVYRVEQVKNFVDTGK